MIDLGALSGFVPRAPRRRGVSLIEVVFAVGVATIGLLAAIALLPVAARRVELGRIEDSKAALGEAALQMCETLAVRDPNQWRTLARSFGGTGPYVGVPYNDVTLRSLGPASGSPPAFASFPGGETRRIDAGTFFNSTSASYSVFGTVARPINWAPIHAFCIDPWLLSDVSTTLALENGTPRNTGVDSMGNPGATADVSEYDDAFYNLQYFPYYIRHPYETASNASRKFPMFNMRRLTLSATPGRTTPGIAGAVASNALSQAQAERFFASLDNVRFLREDANRAAPARQSPYRAIARLDPANTGSSPLSQISLRRESTADFSWMVTLAPERFVPNKYGYSFGRHPITGASYDFLVQGQSSYLSGDGTYTMSVAVHYRRPRPATKINPTAGSYSGATYDTANTEASEELVARIASPAIMHMEGSDPKSSRGFYGGGIGGGEALIETQAVGGKLEQALRPLQSIKAGSWIMVSGAMSGVTPTGPLAPTTFGPATVSADNPALPLPPEMWLNGAPPPYMVPPSDITVAPRPIAIRHQWYRVVSVGEILNPTDIAVADHYGLPVTLQGADWQIDPVIPAQVTIVPSVVAVFEKSVTLEEPLN